MLTATDSTTATNVQMVRDYTERVFNGHQPRLAAQYMTADAVWHGGNLGTVEGRDNIVGLLEGFIGALPDLHAAEHDMLAQGDLVAVRYVVEATHLGDLVGIPPTGRPVRWDAIDLYRLSDGKIAEEWAADDMTSILHAIGVFSPPWLA